MKEKIDLYLITGFLGSGKTTFLKQLIEQNYGKRIGIIVNEFGSTSIDGIVLREEGVELIEINNGSIFCACLKVDFVKTLKAFLNQPIDILFIEASGMADPSSMKELINQMTALFEKNESVDKEYSYKGSACLVDSAMFLDYCEIFLPTSNQVRKSSLVIVNKVDTVDKMRLKEVHDQILEYNPAVMIYDTTFGKVPLEIFQQNALSEEINQETSTNTLNNRPYSITLNMSEKYNVEKMKRFSMDLSKQLLRFKGFFKSEDDKTIHADCVGDYISMNVIDKEYRLNNKYELVLIGKNGEEFGRIVKQVWENYFPDKILTLIDE